ncbi:hypothetical protein D9619_010548 [Psilocybe cf. subviscida]|uniref:Uncharacterized protein n=1 Tax=Psilocybe cf. subviscida TaxID=2480587 RepID=A0A8H5AS72_9AGAR|nr:hypothetical protein D9619_010548 [Psilocybe cf. subviscida]
MSRPTLRFSSTFYLADTPDEIRHKVGISNPSASRNVRNSLQNSATSSINPGIGFLHTNVNTSPAISIQSTPHRAWESGYQSPFARTLVHPSQPFPIPPSDIQPSPLTVATSSSQHPHDMPQRNSSYRQRIRKVVTKEITLSDIDVSAMVTLGLPPFMVGQDMIANQNRFVRNECIFARQLLRLHRAKADADARHSQTERNIYNHLEQHRAALHNITNGSGSTTWASRSTGTIFVRTDPDFLALEKAHQETCARLEVLARQSAEALQSMQGALIELAQRLDQVVRTVDYLTRPEAIPRLPVATTPPISPCLWSTNSTNLKRKRDSSEDSILASPGTMPPPTPDFRDHICLRTR